MLFSITVLLVALIASLIFGNPAKSGNSEFRNVDASKLQAVFLNGGQVYFGKINSLNPQFMRMSDIYYLRVNQQVQPGQTQPADDGISLVKLGCELHGPTDSMVINREQVIFWENLKEDGQVAKAVKEFKDKNPEGQKCEQPQQGSNATEPAANDAPATPPATPPADAGNATVCTRNERFRIRKRSLFYSSLLIQRSIPKRETPSSKNRPLATILQPARSGDQ
jgi:hypothetical protein